jgi:hypothetical protein
MATRRHVVSVTTASDGTATAYSPYFATGGKIAQISYVKPGSGSYDDGVDFTITVESTGQTLWTESDVNATKHCCPRTATHSTAGVAATLDGTRAALDAVRIGNRDRVKIVLASGGNAKVGAFHILVED